MVLRKMGNSGIAVSPIGMGCWAYGGGSYWGEQSQADVNDVVARSLDEGVNFFDTAEAYNNGESERSLGIALKGKRDRAVICSKVETSNAYYDELIAHCEATLQRLETDYIDVYMMHWPINPRALMHFTADSGKIANPPTTEEAMAALMKLKQDGKVRAIGVSNYGVEQLKEVLALGAEIDVNEIAYNIVSRAIEAQIIPFCCKHNISIVSTMTLQQGLLTGRYAAPDEVPMSQAHSRHFANARGQGMSRHGGPGAEKELFETIHQLRIISWETGISMSQLSIAWALSKPGITTALVGCRNITEFEENVQAAAVRLDDDIIHRVDEISQPVLDALGSNPDYYESDENTRIH